MESKLTVLFEDPFWIGIFEVNDNGMFSVCKYTFGSEPTDNVIYELILNSYYKLPFSKPLKDEYPKEAVKRINPKRLQRMIRKQTEEKGIGTKAQRAISEERESRITQRKSNNKEMKMKEKEYKYEKKQMKKKLKRKGH